MRKFLRTKRLFWLSAFQFLVGAGISWSITSLSAYSQEGGTGTSQDKSLTNTSIRKFLGSDAGAYIVRGQPASKAQYDAAKLLDDGLLLLRSNADEQAAEKFKQSMAIFDYPEAHHSLGLAYAKLGKTDEASAELKRATELNPGFSDSWFLLAGLYQSSGKLQEAVNAYNEFLRRFPDDPASAKVNSALGILNAKLGQSETAVAELLKAVELNPLSAASWISLAGVYQAKGELDAAIRTYDEFLNRFPDDAICGKVRNLKEALLKEKNKAEARKSADLLLKNPGPGPDSEANGAGTRGGTPRDDYLGIMLPLKRWPRSRLPITVYIADGSNVAGYRASFRDILKKSFEDWAKASDGILSFEYVDRPEAARLKCDWTDKAEKLNGTEAGSARLEEDQSYISNAQILFLTRNSMERAGTIGDEFFRMLALHEIGHALGLSGHTSNPEDIMFYSAGFKNGWRELSGRDARTIKALYRSDI